MSGQSVQASAGRTKMYGKMYVYVLKCKVKHNPLVKPAGTPRAALALLSAPASFRPQPPVHPSMLMVLAKCVRLQTELLTRLQKSREGEGGLGERESKGGLGERETRETKGGLGERENKKRSTGPSRVVPHRSTTPARTCLTSLFGWEAVSQADMAAALCTLADKPSLSPTTQYASLEKS